MSCASIATALLGPGDATLIWALVQYVVGAGPIAGLAAVFGGISNMLRAGLLYKTHTLLLRRERNRGLPSPYVLEHDLVWYGVYRCAKRLFPMNVGAALLHGWLFLSQQVVLSASVATS